MNSQLSTGNSKLSSAFTLVELIVVITILAILGTIAFISLQGFASSARDSKRVGDMNTIYRGLMFTVESGQQLPLPDSNITEIFSSGALVAIQGDFTNTLGGSIRVFGDLSDPQSGDYYTYVVSQNRLKFAVGGLTESLVVQSDNHSTFNLTQALANFRNVYIRGDRVGMFFDTDNTPIQRTGVTDLDLFTVSDTYRVHFSTQDFLEGDNQELMMASPTASCRRIFDTTSNIAGNAEYIINPRGQEFRVFCHYSFPDMNFYDFIEDGDFEDIFANNWDNNRKTSAAARTGEYGFANTNTGTGSRIFVSNNYTYVDSSQVYELSGFFRSPDPSALTRLHFGLEQFDEDFRRISSSTVIVIEGTETPLVQDVNPDDTTLVFENTNGEICNTWQNADRFLTNARVAFDVDATGAYADLPNRNLSYRPSSSELDGAPYGFLGITDNGATCTLQLRWPAGVEYSAGTYIRMHRHGGARMYAGTSGSVTVPNEWTQYSGIIHGRALHGNPYNQFWPGTRFVRVFFIMRPPSGSITPPTLHVDDLTLEVF